VGGEVKPPVLVRRVEPRYPPLAIQTRTQGVVQIECVIGVDGRVSNMQVVSGPALLIQAAMNAVREWRYRPTMLNDDPVEVIMRVDVRFQLR
jgi:protein TonB